jgi:hypothetical protein
MKLNNKALMTSGGIGAVINILLQLCFGSALFAPMLGPDAAAAVAGFVGLVAIVSCLCGGIIAIGIGFSYVYFAKSDGPVQLVDGAIGGAIANGVAGLIGGLLSACLSTVAPIAVTASAGGTPDVATALAGGIGGVIGAICGGFIVGGIFGAIGGAIGAATVGKPS